MYFLDTCIFIHASHKHSGWFDKTRKTVFKEKWLTSNIVVEELEAIHKRRKTIYSNIISFDYNELEGEKIEIFYNRCIKSALGGNKNDEKHLLKLYNYVIESTTLKNTDILNKERIEKMKAVIFHLLVDIKIRLGNFVHNFKNDALYYGEHVVPEVWDSLGKYLRNQLYRIDHGTQNKLDLRIVTDAAIYSNDNNINLDIVTSDGYLLNMVNDIKQIIKSMEIHHVKSKRLHAKIDIIHIKDITTMPDT